MVKRDVKGVQKGEMGCNFLKFIGWNLYLVNVFRQDLYRV